MTEEPWLDLTPTLYWSIAAKMFNISWREITLGQINRAKRFTYAVNYNASPLTKFNIFFGEPK